MPATLPKKILLFEDESILEDLERVFKAGGWDTVSAESLEVLLTLVDEGAIDGCAVALLDHNVPGDHRDLPRYTPRAELLNVEKCGLHVGAWLHGGFPSVLINFYTREFTTELAELAQQFVADAAVLHKVGGTANLNSVVTAMDALWERWERSQRGIPAGLAGRRFEAIATSTLPVLLLGEPGTGKNHLAHQLHKGGPVGALVHLQCALDPDAALSALRNAVARSERATVLLEDVEHLGARGGSTLARLLASTTPARVIATSALPLPELAKQIGDRAMEQLSAWEITLPPISLDVDRALELADARLVARGLQFEAGARAELQSMVKRGWFDAAGRTAGGEGGNFRGLIRVVDRAADWALHSTYQAPTVAFDHLEAAKARQWPGAEQPSNAPQILALTSTLTRTSGELMKRLGPRFDPADPVVAAAIAEDGELAHALAHRLLRDVAAYTAGAPGRRLADWLEKPAHILANEELSFDSAAVLRWRWVALLAALLITPRVGAGHKNVAKVFTGKEDNNAAAAIRLAYERMLSGVAPDLEFPGRQTRGADGSLLPLIITDLTWANPEPNPAVVVADKRIEAGGLRFPSRNAWPYLRAVFRDANARYTSATTPPPKA